MHAALVAVQVGFASLGTAAKIAMRELPPRGLVAARATAAAVVLGLAWSLGRRERVAKTDVARIAVYALFGIVANQLLFIEGLERSTATNGAVLGASIPVFTVGIAVALGRERATWTKLAGLGVALAGALAVTGGSVLDVAAGGRRVLAGNLLFLANSLVYAIYLVVSRDVLARYRAMTVVALTMLFGAVGVLPFGAPGLAAAAPHASATTWLVVAYIVAVPTIGTYFLNAWALARVASSFVAIYIFLQPVLGAALAAALLGERPTGATVAGAAAILAGIRLVTRRRDRG